MLARTAPNCNSEKMVVLPPPLPPTTNQWPQNHLNEKSLMSSTTKLMEKPSAAAAGHSQELSQTAQQQQPLKCPRCDSSNTKFCYYNNYSLSQPRHFCKACKRYWTRGGTLRNVPVGGGCRKNKRVRRAGASGVEGTSNSSSSGTTTYSANINPNPTPTQPQIDHISSSTSNPLFYGLHANPSEMNLPFPGRFSNTTCGGYDLQPQLNSLAIGFSSSSGIDHSNGFNSSKQIQDVLSSSTNSLLISSYDCFFGSTSAATTTSPTIATLLASTLQQHKFNIKGCSNHSFQGLTSLEDLQVSGNINGTAGGISSSSSSPSMKQVKIEAAAATAAGGHENRLDWNHQIEQIGFSDPNSLYWNTSTGGGVGAWHDPANLGSSVTSLI